jgi:hypothetical protein
MASNTFERLFSSGMECGDSGKGSGLDIFVEEWQDLVAHWYACCVLWVQLLQKMMQVAALSLNPE